MNNNIEFINTNKEDLERLRALQQRLEDMLISADIKELVHQIDYNYFGDTRLDTTRMLYSLKSKITQPEAQKKLDKVINHYCYEKDGLIILRS